jgi:hypothetical protein
MEGMMPVEDAGKAVSNTVDALKQQPLILALVVLQGFVLAAVLYNSLHRQTAIDKQFAHLFEVLETCVKGNLPVSPQQRGDLRLLLEPVPLPPPRPRPPEPPP